MKAVEANPQATFINSSAGERPVALQHMVYGVETARNLPIADSDFQSTYGEVHPLQPESCALLVHYSKDDRVLTLSAELRSFEGTR
ncbi:hypothetical protein M514_11657 [Trichuris suis]|uniref:Uncharacterized protein n=1 Tax=Trichuris suis TaxID=68888 RepID=A0A085LRA0_9BILA|nr:hypothetical protein M513_11657 [Trichuris suis]KFD60358.1 hypothetical protein M514_11657 [Trichuris suis]KHJ42494.1 hypothetical protein D918_07416 [Trichuris suis]